MIILIKTKDGSKYWADNYILEKDQYTISTKTKEGIERVVKVSKDQVIEIIELDKDFG